MAVELMAIKKIKPSNLHDTISCFCLFYSLFILHVNPLVVFFYPACSDSQLLARSPSLLTFIYASSSPGPQSTLSL